MDEYDWWLAKNDVSWQNPPPKKKQKTKQNKNQTKPNQTKPTPPTNKQTNKQTKTKHKNAEIEGLNNGDNKCRDDNIDIWKQKKIFFLHEIIFSFEHYIKILLIKIES